MQIESNAQAATPPAPQSPTVKIIGVGGAGLLICERMAAGGFAGAQFAAINTDSGALAASGVSEKVLLDSKGTRGKGTGGDPERGNALAEEHFPKLKTLCQGADVVFLVTALGGGAGTGICPVLARAAKEAGALALAFVTLPFNWEGVHRQDVARHGLHKLQAAADGVICLPNQKLLKIADKDKTTLADSYKAATQLLIESARGLWQLIGHTGLIQIQLDELCGVLRDRQGEASFAQVEAAGPTRSRDAIEKLLAHPMLEGGQALAEAEAALVRIVSGSDLTMADMDRVMEQINQKCGRARVLIGADQDEAYHDRLSLTVVAIRRACGEPAMAGIADSTATATAGARAAGEDASLAAPHSTSRSQPGIEPLARTLTSSQRDPMTGQNSGGDAKSRKSPARMRQGTLPLEIINKGRFEKTEPTVHKGEDLDVPTYVRRGVSLN